MTVARRGGVILLLAFSFGVLAALLKGDGSSVARSAIGNLSAPWLLFALVPAWWAGSAVRGALLGTAATLAALAGFYIGVTTLLYGDLGGATGAVPSLRYVFAANAIWFGAGLVSGPVCGALAGWLGHRLPATWLLVISSALFVVELPVVRLATDFRIPVLNIGWGVADWRAYQAQAFIGLLVLGSLGAVAVRRRIG